MGYSLEQASPHEKIFGELVLAHQLGWEELTELSPRNSVRAKKPHWVWCLKSYSPKPYSALVRKSSRERSKNYAWQTYVCKTLSCHNDIWVFLVSIVFGQRRCSSKVFTYIVDSYFGVCGPHAWCFCLLSLKRVILEVLWGLPQSNLHSHKTIWKSTMEVILVDHTSNFQVGDRWPSNWLAISQRPWVFVRALQRLSEPGLPRISAHIAAPQFANTWR